ncbi:hypothetical protein NQ318_019959 [Aromia moschata]|uniref:CCHC-type domain-containing protein n=1 Tax=Aromia moschata TaxID=1265417 RepID=A0AAV8Y7C7_9CUCU|nr:hypothetical protein NQ318_019959 [Aromia moschata]
MIEPFNTNEPSKWRIYVEIFQFFLTANGITHEIKKIAVFLSICGLCTYDIIHSLIALQAVADVDLKFILDKLAVHFLPRKSTVVARFIFHRWNQRPDENISSYVKELRRSTGDWICRDHRSTKYQTTNNVKSCQKKCTKLKACFRCGNSHDPEECPFKEAQCHFCKKKGHIERACLSKKRSLKKGTFNKNKQTSGQPEIKKSSGQSRVQNLEVETVNDSNPCYDILSVQDQLCSKDLVMPSQVIEILGSCNVQVQLGAKVVTLPLVVAESNRGNLLGRNWFEPLQIKSVARNAAPIFNIGTIPRRPVRLFYSVAENSR